MTATIEVQALAQEWVGDREAMANERREALLDWVRDEADKWRRDLGLSAMPGHISHELDLPLLLSTALCEEAGLVAPAQDGPKETR